MALTLADSLTYTSPVSSGPLHHIPVLHSAGEGKPSPVLTALRPKPGESVLDVTLGLGGHAEAFLEATSPDGRLTALDADSQNLAFAKKRLERFSGRVTFHHVNFKYISELALEPVDIVFADLGLSSPHIDDAQRGFSFRSDAPLDLRFDRTAGQTGAELLRDSDPKEIVRILRDYGEISKSRSLAEALSREFRAGAGRTSDVKRITEQVYGFRAASLLPQVFQALRIAVNDEVWALENLLQAIPVLLRPGGRAGIISYHSLEDRLVKDTFRALSTPERNDVTGADLRPADFALLTKKPIVSDEEEVARNPRSRSAKFRVLRKQP